MNSSKVRFPKGAIVGAIVRDEEIIIPRGDSIIRPISEFSLDKGLILVGAYKMLNEGLDLSLIKLSNELQTEFKKSYSFAHETIPKSIYQSKDSSYFLLYKSSLD